MQVEFTSDDSDFLGTDGVWYVADPGVEVLNARVEGKVVASATFFVGNGDEIDEVGVCLADLDGPYFQPGPTRPAAERVLHLRSLYTRPRFRGQGLMWQLVERVAAQNLPVYVEFQNPDLPSVFERVRAATEGID